MKEAVKVSPEHPVLIDKYLDNAVEIDVDALCDGNDVYVAAIMEHIEEAIRTNAAVFPSSQALTTLQYVEDVGDNLSLYDKAWEQVKQ